MPQQTNSDHIINALPRIQELELMMIFCQNHQHLYIYDTSQETDLIEKDLLLKYFDMVDVHISGYVARNDVDIKDAGNGAKRGKIAIKPIEAVMKETGTGIIIIASNRGQEEKSVSGVTKFFDMKGFDEYFVLSEYNRRTIIAQITPRTKEHTGFEINLVDHCNLSCQMCDHYSQLSSKCFLSIEQFEKDVHQMGKVFNHQIGGGIPVRWRTNTSSSAY